MSNIKFYAPVDFDDTSSGLTINGDLTVDTNVLYVDTTNNKVGIGTSNPYGKLHVTSNSSGATPISQQQLILENNTATGIAILTPSTTSGYLFFGDNNDAQRGYIAYNHAADEMKFKVAGSERVFINSSGNVGIGTTSPGTSLHVVSGGIAAQGTSGYDANTSPGVWIGGDGTNALIYGRQSNVWKPTYLDSSALYINAQSGGNVGIGTTSPARPIHVSSAATSIIADFQYTGASYSTIQLTNTGGNAHVSSVNSDLLLSPGTTERMRVKNNGNVLIGTTTDSGYKLSVNGDIQVSDSQADVLINSTTAGQASRLVLNTTTREWRIGTHSGQNNSLWFYDATAGSYRVFIDTSGNLGIGAANPNHKVDIYSNENVPLRIHRPSNANLDSSGAWGIGFSTRGDANTSTTDTRAGIFSYYNGNLFIATSTSDVVADPDASARLTILSGGNVGIGTMSPGDKLTVNGDISVFGNKIYNGSASNSAGIDFSDSQVDLHGYYGIRFFASTAGIGSMTERMRIANTGNVLIGTTTDSGAKLEVAGSVGNFKTTGHQIFLTRNGNNEIYAVGASSVLALGTNSAEKMRITSNGNVGIGTTSPDSTLHVEQDKVTLNTTNLDNGTAVGLHLTYPDTALSGGEGIALAMGMNGRGRSYIANLSATTSKDASDMLFYTENGGVISEQMRINSYGNVGIGTTTATYPLTLYKDLGTGGILAYFKNSNATYGQELYFSFDSNKDISWLQGSGSGGTIFESGSRGISFQINSGDIVKFAGTGNVLIGTTTDNGYKLQVNGDATINGVRVGRGAGNVDGNTVLGSGAFNSNSTGLQNTAIGYQSLRNNTGLYNTALGYQAAYNNTTGERNTAVGRHSLYSNSTGSYNTSLGMNSLTSSTASNNTAIGYGTLFNATTATNNTAVGVNALTSSTSSNNTAVGSNAAQSNTTGSIVAVGYQAGYSNISGSITAIGYNSMYNNTSGTDNTALGNSAMFNNTTGNNNTAIGREALLSNTIGISNVAIGEGSARTSSTKSFVVAIGREALRENDTSSNTAVGYRAAYSNTTGNLVAVGYEAGYSSTTAGQITAIGYQALRNSTGANNTAIGYQALLQNTTGSHNIGIGREALFSNTTGTNNTAIGSQSLLNNTSSFNTAIGYQSGYSNTTGSIVAVGYEAGYSNTTGTEITAIGYQTLKNYTGVQSTALGYQAGYSMTTPSNNTVIGRAAAYSTTTGHSNTALGRSALYNNVSGSQNIAVGINSLVNTTGSQNTAIGSYAGDANTSGSNNIFIGQDSDGVAATDSNRTFIGNSSTTSTWVGGNLLVGTTTDGGQPLQVKGSTNIAYFRGDTGYSDITFSSPVGNEFHMTLGGGDALVFNSTTNERMRLTSSGYLGIGTSSPATLLHLSGSSAVATIQDNNSTGNTASAKILFTDNGTFGTIGTIGFDGNDILQITNSHTGKILLSNTVGVNTSSPAYTLDVNGSFSATTLYGDGSNLTGITATETDTLDSVTGRGATTTNSITVGGLNVDSGTLYVDSTNDRVGIGTSSPSRKLSVYQSSSSIVADFRSASGNDSFVTFSNNASTADQVRLGSSSGNLILSTNYTERMRLTSGGNVLIGTTTDSGYKLDVNGTARISNTLNLTNTTKALQIGPTSENNTNYYIDCGNQLYIRANQSGTDNQYTNLMLQSGTSTQTATIGLVGRGNDSKIYFQTSNTTRMEIKSDGKVGIGTSSPAQELDVSGDINASGDYYANGTQGYTGTVTIQQPSPNPPINIDIQGGIITNVY